MKRILQILENSLERIITDKDHNIRTSTLIHLAIPVIGHSLVSVFDWAWKRYEKRKNNVLSSIKLYERKAHYNDTVQPFYVAVEWYMQNFIQHKQKTQHLEIQHTNAIDKHIRESCIKLLLDGKLTPYYSINLDDGTEVQFEWNNTKFCIKKCSHELRKDVQNWYIQILSDDVTSIKKFIQFCCTQFAQHQHDESLKIFKWSKGQSRLEPNFWKSSKIQVTKTFENIFLDRQMEAELLNDLEQYKEFEQESERCGIPRKRGYLFYGKPGAGKTSTVYAISRLLNRNIFVVDFDKLGDEFHSAIEQIPPNSIVLLDDVDTLAVTNDRTIESTQTDKKPKIHLGDILEVLDGYNYFHDCIIVMTTNYPEKLDPALVRSGRIDRKFGFCDCNFDQLTKILTFYFGKQDFAIDETHFIEKRLSVSDLINIIVIANRTDWKKVQEILNQ